MRCLVMFITAVYLLFLAAKESNIRLNNSARLLGHGIPVLAHIASPVALHSMNTPHSACGQYCLPQDIVIRIPQNPPSFATKPAK